MISCSPVGHRPILHPKGKRFHSGPLSTMMKDGATTSCISTFPPSIRPSIHGSPYSKWFLFLYIDFRFNRCVTRLPTLLPSESRRSLVMAVFNPDNRIFPAKAPSRNPRPPWLRIPGPTKGCSGFAAPTESRQRISYGCCDSCCWLFFLPQG